MSGMKSLLGDTPYESRYPARQRKRPRCSSLEGRMTRKRHKEWIGARRPLRTRACIQCGKDFTYEIGRGLDRKHCSKLCQGRYHRATKALRVGYCSVQNCVKPAMKGDLCSMHSARLYRHGDLDVKLVPKRKPSGRAFRCEQGYYRISTRDHPLARQGMVYLHRLVLYNAIGEGPHPCRWCGRQVGWRADGQHRLVVDHLDGDKANNDLSNLLASCAGCNSSRAHFMNWIKKHGDDPLIAPLLAPKRNAA